eukprot:scaffold676_cov316-Pavlova_lutheri.AAC.31
MANSHSSMHVGEKRWVSIDATDGQGSHQGDGRSTLKHQRTLSERSRNGARRTGAGRRHGERTCSSGRDAKWTRAGESQLHVRDEVSAGGLGRTGSEGMVASSGRSVADGDDEDRCRGVCRVCGHYMLLGGGTGREGRTHPTSTAVDGRACAPPGRKGTCHS